MHSAFAEKRVIQAAIHDNSHHVTACCYAVKGRGHASQSDLRNFQKFWNVVLCLCQHLAVHFDNRRECDFVSVGKFVFNIEFCFVVTKQCSIARRPNKNFDVTKGRRVKVSGKLKYYGG